MKKIIILSHLIFSCVGFINADQLVTSNQLIAKIEYNKKIIDYASTLNIGQQLVIIPVSVAHLLIKKVPLFSKETAFIAIPAIVITSLLQTILERLIQEKTVENMNLILQQIENK